jgi:hypothetical protein
MSDVKFPRVVGGQTIQIEEYFHAATPAALDREHRWKIGTKDQKYAVRVLDVYVVPDRDLSIKANIASIKNPNTSVVKKAIDAFDVVRHSIQKFRGV